MAFRNKYEINMSYSKRDDGTYSGKSRDGSYTITGEDRTGKETGKKFMRFKVEGEDHKFQINAFVNEKRNERQPDFTGYDKDSKWRIAIWKKMGNNGEFFSVQCSVRDETSE